MAKNIGDIIKEMTNDKNAQFYSALAKIVSVDKSEKTCVVEPLDGSPKIYGVKYAVSGDSSGFDLIPTKNSVVVVSFFSPSTAFISQMNTFDKITIQNATTSVKTIFSDILTAIKAITVTSSPSGGPTSPPINSAAFTAIEQKVEQLFDK